jgi:hypothetical protein
MGTTAVRSRSHHSYEQLEAAMIQARFYVQSVKQFAGGADANKEITLQAVTRKTDDNITWSKYTPSGQIVMNVRNDQVTFEIGKDYLVSFELADDSQ